METKTLKMAIDEEFIPLMVQASQNKWLTDGEISIKRLDEEVSGGHPFSKKVFVEVTCTNDTDFFMLGFWVERLREKEQRKHYDLGDNQKVEVEVPGAFVLLSKFFGSTPEGLLKLFAGDACQHPFITGGSDERMMARDYLLRGCISPLWPLEEAPVVADALFYNLNVLRCSWQGNDKMDQFKTEYSKGLKTLERKFILKKK